MVERRIPSIVFLHNLNFAQMDGELFQHELLRYATVSEFMASALTARLGARPDVVPPLIDPASFRTNTSRDVVTFVNPTAVKGLDIALQLAARRPDIAFEFVESWPLRPQQAKNLASSLARLPNVRLLPRTDDMRSVYSRSRLLLMPSQWEEPWGRVAAEAQVSGIPVLASRIGGLPEVVGPGGGLVDPDDLDGWERALSAVWDDKRRYDELAQHARAHAERHDIQPAGAMARFLDLATAHMARTRRA
jgi:glycosyltransferase involved in cell wall biosynthesis